MNRKQSDKAIRLADQLQGMKKTKEKVIATSQMPEMTGISPEELIARAIDKGLPVDTMERILAMGREIRAERAKAEYDHAMSVFQSECPTIKKTKEVRTKSGVVAYRYAPIESIVEQTKNTIQRNGFSYSTSMELMQDGVKVTVRITHEGGHSEESSMQVPFGNKTEIMSQSQVTAAATTFAKRYAFCNGFGITTGDEDTDARPDTSNTSYQAKTPQNSKMSVTARPVREYATQQQLKTLTILMAELATSQSTIEKQIGKPLIQLTPQDAQKVINDLEKIKAQRIEKNKMSKAIETVVCKTCEQAVDITEYSMDQDMCDECAAKMNNTLTK